MRAQAASHISPRPRAIFLSSSFLPRPGAEKRKGMESPRPKHSHQNMKHSKNMPGSAVSSIRSLSSRDGQVSIDSVSSPSIAPHASSAPLDNGLPANPNRMRDNFKITVMGDTGVGKSELVKKVPLLSLAALNG